MVRGLASHQCGLGSIPGPDVICGMSLVLVLVPAPMDFRRFVDFPPSTKTNISKFQFDLETVDKESLRGFATANSHLSYYYYFILFLVPTGSASFPSYPIGTKVLNWHVPVWTVCSSRAFVEQLPRLAWHVQRDLNQPQSRGTVLWQV